MLLDNLILASLISEKKTLFLSQATRESQPVIIKEIGTRKTLKFSSII